EKLRSYTWDAKAVIALAAFALDYGETWRLSLMKAASKENGLELHVFRLGEFDNPKQPNADLISTLVDRTLQLIEGIIKLEKLIANKAYSAKDVPALYKAPRDLYTYWAILSLLACANQMTELDWHIKSEVVGRLKIVLTQLNADLDEIKIQIASIEDLTWRFTVFQTYSGILELLKALIFPRDIKQLEIFDNTAQELVNHEVLKTKNLLLFISGLDNIEDEISAIKSIHDSLTKDKDKQDYKILWIPVVEKWNNDEKSKFEKLKSLMPWYVVHYFSLIKGFKVLQEEWNYQGKPIVVVTNPRGEVINRNALHMIFVWGIRAFPFGVGDIDKLSQHWNWFWTEAFKIHPTIELWVTQENKYIFFYGGTDIKWTQTFGSLVDDIKKDPIMKETDTYIEQFNLGTVDSNITSKFWVNITNSFLSKIQKDHFEVDLVLKDIQTLLSMQTEKGWALLSKGKNVLVIGYNESMVKVLEDFKKWKTNVVELQGFDNAFKHYYDQISTTLPLHCVHFHLENIRSGVPLSMGCPAPSCNLKMEIESVNYKCCHGIHYDHITENGEAPTLVPKTN
ncbi:protein SIEVE ELEMENT OCCLUSION B-like, partial [Gastrolobium bilobum]|uniref:protein SIEVE ELEMENT OCCLUSION B-like n=1 Tax=Gastrolobium bilobum TaxID=150636 RepID=UPI002AAF9425